MKKILTASIIALSATLLLAAKTTSGSTFIFQNTPVMKLIQNSNQTPAQKNKDLQQMYVDQFMFADLWMQDSGEYKALCYQAFNAAKYRFLQYKIAHPDIKKIAVVVDLDETMLDNEAQSARQLETDQVFNSKMWNTWVESEQVKATPGSVAFSHFIENHGGTIFYISDRNKSTKKYTIASLKKLGFANVSDSTVLLRTTTGDKVTRFNEVKARGYTIIIHIGDNLSDLTGDTYGKSNTQRVKWVETNKQNFGVKYFVIPNPIYGGWVSGLAKNYYSHTTAQQLQLDANNLHPWNGK